MQPPVQEIGCGTGVTDSQVTKHIVAPMSNPEEETRKELRCG